jgi:hypothetical protein
MRGSRWLVLALAVWGCGSDGGGEASNAGGTKGTGGSTAGGGGNATGGAGGTSGGAGGSGASAGSGANAGSGGLSGPPTLKRIGSTLEIPTIAAAAPKRFVDVAHDPAHDVYLVVHGNAAIGGAFLDADAKPLGAPFSIADTTAWTQAPRVAFADGPGTFLVAWHDTRDNPNQAKLRARSVKWNGTAAELASADFSVSAGTTYQEMPPAIAYSTASNAFFVVWHATPNDDLHAARVSPTGQVLGSELTLTDDPDWQSDAALAYNPDRDEFLLAWAHAGASTEVRVIRVKGSDGTLLGGTQTLTQAGGTWLPQVVYVPASQRYLVAWYEGSLQGRWLDADAAPQGAAFPLAPGYGAYDGFALGRNSALGATAAVFHGPTDEDFAMGMSDAAEQGPVFEATSSPGTQGHFNPRVAAHSTRPEWLLATVRGFEAVEVQRIGP